MIVGCRVRNGDRAKAQLIVTRMWERIGDRVRCWCRVSVGSRVRLIMRIKGEDESQGEGEIEDEAEIAVEGEVLE